MVVDRRLVNCCSLSFVSLLKNFVVIFGLLSNINIIRSVEVIGPIIERSAEPGTTTHYSSGSKFTISSSLIGQYNDELKVYNHLGAELAWNISIDLNNGMKSLEKNEELLVHKNLWNNDWCLKLLAKKSELQLLSEARQIYLICRGPRFSSYQVSKLLSILGQLRSVYDTTKICLEDSNENSKHCYPMEPDLNHFMETTRHELKLREAWVKWHSSIGESLTKPYFDLIRLMNIGAKQAGRSDIGSCWREEMETENLIEKSLQLYNDVKYLYSLLHSFVRYKLAEFYGLNLKGQPIPAHLLGNMWSQRWDSLIDIIEPSIMEKEATVDKAAFINKNIGPNANVDDMVQFAENYYIKMGFPKLPTKFHENSYFTSTPNSTSKNCHGSAANMFSETNDDYRIMMCASVQDSDLATMIHEMGHIHYFMAYQHLPTIFQDGANAAFHEAIGDSTTYGMYPNPNIHTLLKLGLAKLPQIGFGLIVDLWRWKIFELADTEYDHAVDAGMGESTGSGSNIIESWNDLWWKLQFEYMGISKPSGYVSNGLDALGKYHIVDNVPYIRYFDASFLQHMFYDAMCGKEQVYCNLDGRGHGLRKMMSEGSSKHWSVVLQELTGSNEITSTPLLNYFKPLEKYLENQLAELGLSVGW